ncbi:MAG: YARHG domain-containing protein [Janthinobacterium lividum]
MRLAVITVALPLVLLGYIPAKADECSELWFSRNQIYKGAGYCFKTTRAIAAFGNAGCQYDDMRDVPLSEKDRIAVGRYVREEAVLGCRS